MRLSLLFIKNDCRVNIVFDGVTRHHTKRSTTKRIVDCYRTKIDMQVAKCELLSLSEQHKYANTDEQKSLYNKQIIDLRKKIKSLEKKMSDTSVDVGERLHKQVLEYIDRLENDYCNKDIKKSLPI
jgi:hypothetical protein